MNNEKYTVGEAVHEEFDTITRLLPNVYAQLDGFPKKDEQPGYYRLLFAVAAPPSAREDPGRTEDLSFKVDISEFI